MRFRAKFGALGWCWVSLTLFVLILWFSGLHSKFVGIAAFANAGMALQQILNHVFIYWEVGPENLHERRLWSSREIPVMDLVRVGGWHGPSSDYLEIDYARPAPMSDRGSVVANPEDRPAFIAALHRFAPLAEFDV